MTDAEKSPAAPPSARIPAKYTPVVFAFFMSMLMAFMMSAVLTFVNLGPMPPPVFVGKWMHAFAVAWFFAFFAALVAGPIVKRIVARLVQPAPSGQ